MERKAPAGRGFSAVDREDDHSFFFTLLDRQAAHPAIVALRARGNALLAPAPGMRLLDVGCGTGDVARELAGAVAPDGSVIGVDASAVMIDEARRRAGDDAVEFRVGDAQRLEFPDASFDGARSERTFQHLADPGKALDEMTRVVRPGGRIVVIDTDWESATLEGVSLELSRKMQESMLAFESPSVGRRLLGMLRGAGLADVQMEPAVMAHTHFDPETQEGPPIPTLLERAVQDGQLTEQEAKRCLADLLDVAASGRFLAAVTMYLVAGTRT